MSPRVLIVDDEAYVRLLIEQTLEDLEDDGVELLAASNGEEALELIKESPPELVFLDVMMPKKDGIEVCRTLKHELGVSNVYIIMLTAKGQEFDKRSAEEAGADEYITKPLDPDELYAKALEVLGLKPVG